MFRRLVFLIFISSFSFAQNKSDISALEQELKLIKIEVSAQQKLLSESNLELSNAEKDLDRINKKILEKEKSLEEFKKELKNLNSSINEVNSNILINKGKISILKQNYKSRIRSMYKLDKSVAFLDFLMDSSNLIQLEKRRTFLSRIAQADRELILVVSSTIKDLQKYYKQIKKLKIKREEKLNLVTITVRDLNIDKSKKDKYVRQKRKRTETIKLVLSRLKSTADRLDVTIRTLLDNRKVKKIFELSKNTLVFPIEGTLLHGYGKRKHKEFKDFIFSKGLEIKPNPNSKVKAVASGQVILNKDLPGYGKVIIVDHGSRVYSLYARIKDNLVNLGQKVDAGQYLASTTEPIYFELRKKGKALNPSAYFIN